MTSVTARNLAEMVTRQTGLAFEAENGVDASGQQWYLLSPHGCSVDQTFRIRTVLGWRRLWMKFEPGKFARSLIGDMGGADADGRSVFRAILADSCRLGSQVDLQVNGRPVSFDDEDIWSVTWSHLVLSMKKGQLELGTAEGESDDHILCRWTGRFATAVVAILPVVDVGGKFDRDVVGFPEGAQTRVHVNRYERDRRNRASAIAIHGTACKACGLNMSERYGPIAQDLVEVHHITPASQLGPGYVIDPVCDLVPLCPNCHAVVHRNDPPLDVDQVSSLLNQR